MGWYLSSGAVFAGVDLGQEVPGVAGEVDLDGVPAGVVVLAQVLVLVADGGLVHLSHGGELICADQVAGDELALLFGQIDDRGRRLREPRVVQVVNVGLDDSLEQRVSVLGVGVELRVVEEGERHCVAGGKDDGVHGDALPAWQFSFYKAFNRYAP